jgi:hypothetical protein
LNATGRPETNGGHVGPSLGESKCSANRIAEKNALLLSACRLFFDIALMLACHAEAQVS